MERYEVQPIQVPGQRRPSAWAVCRAGEVIDAYRQRELAESYVAYVNRRLEAAEEEV